MNYITPDEAHGQEQLIIQRSVNNEMTVTRVDGLRYSTIKFKPTDRHHVDIEITQGTHHDCTVDMLVTPSPYKKKTVKGRVYSNLAKMLAVLVLFLLLLMMCVVIASLVLRVPHSHDTPRLQGVAKSNDFDPVGVHHDNNETTQGNFTSDFNHTSVIIPTINITSN